jgi:predicted CXXCH cytochrome family protein
MDGDKVKMPINCLTCHQPHSSTQAGLLVKDQANNMAFCSTCHNGKDVKDVVGGKTQQ